MSKADKLWFMQFNVGDWLKDPCVSLLRPATRGIWMDAICVMHELDQCGQIHGTVSDLARVCRCSPNEMRAALDDLKQRNAAEVTERNGLVTLLNRRMRRLWTDRKSNAERQQRWKSAKQAPEVTPEVTGEITPLINNKSSEPYPPKPPRGGRKRGSDARREQVLAEAGVTP
jgi:hypothetical protein